MNPNREYRTMELRIVPPEESQEKSYKVRGYASTFDKYKLLTIDGIDYYEKIEPTAFDGADLSDGDYDFVGIRSVPINEFTRMLVKLLKREHLTDKAVLHIRANNFKISSII